MYKNIMVPIDLVHQDHLDKAIATAVDIAKLYGSTITFVAVTATPPSKVAHNPEEFARVLEEYTAGVRAKYDIDIAAKALVSHDPAVDLDETLNKELHALGADLVIMASHVPHFREYVFASNAGFLAGHTDVSVMVVR
ncbi:universal stress protein [Rhodobium gokarnense]|uniref:Nucleotide-binding universal stress UspA family protein n=1 Tax=Rhodobium gokarnense TaxID=364296 RepID=A0ABT3H9I4_9HYPH|nr:universal stress protein [Rhodobium gokarnense]MCW2307063.1 nucleotide-binding universal stress UspA family protein [Rhodobium gokarnense]